MLQKLLKDLAQRLDAAAIPYMVIGGQAVLLYGEPRLTKDIDVTLGVGLEKWAAVEAAAKDLGLTPVFEDARDFAAKNMVFPCSDKSGGLRVDFVFSFSPYERQAVERARHVDMGGVPVRFASLEDLVIHKVVAARPRDLEDVKSVLAKNPSYDAVYIERWLKEFDAALGRRCRETFHRIVESLK